MGESVPGIVSPLLRRMRPRGSAQQQSCRHLGRQCIRQCDKQQFDEERATATLPCPHPQERRRRLLLHHPPRRANSRVLRASHRHPNSRKSSPLLDAGARTLSTTMSQCHLRATFPLACRLRRATLPRSSMGVVALHQQLPLRRHPRPGARTVSIARAAPRLRSGPCLIAAGSKSRSPRAPSVPIWKVQLRPWPKRRPKRRPKRKRRTKPRALGNRWWRTSKENR